MNRLTTLITTIVLGTALGYGVATQTDDATFIGPPPSAEAGQITEIGNPPSNFDGGDTPVCLSCD